MLCRLWVSDKEFNNENEYMLECNKVKHKLTVTGYMSGDDRDHWALQCTECSHIFGFHSGTDEPDLNFCPKCSPKSEIVYQDNILSSTYVEKERYAYDIWTGNGNETCLARRSALETPEYISIKAIVK